MVVGIGVDLLKIERIEDIISKRGTNFVNKVFTEKEISGYSSSRSTTSAEYYALIFSAKESILKAFGIGWDGVDGKDIEIGHDHLGAPTAILRGNLSKLADSKNVKKIFLSLSFDSDYVITICTLE